MHCYSPRHLLHRRPPSSRPTITTLPPEQHRPTRAEQAASNRLDHPADRSRAQTHVAANTNQPPITTRAAAVSRPLTSKDGGTIPRIIVRQPHCCWLYTTALASNHSNQTNTMALLTSTPNAKHSSITNLTSSPPAPLKDLAPGAPSSHPHILHSTIDDCTFTNLTAGSRVSHSTLYAVEIALPSRPAAAAAAPSSSGCRCRLQGSTTRIKHSSLRATSLTNVAHAGHVQASDSVLSNLASVSRVSIRRSSITGPAEGGRAVAVERAEVRDSALAATEVCRSTLESVRAERSQLRRTVLRDCDVGDCVIERTQLTGMRLRNGAWKNGRLVGSVGVGREVEAEPVSLVRVSFSLLRPVYVMGADV